LQFTSAGDDKLALHNNMMHTTAYKVKCTQGIYDLQYNLTYVFKEKINLWFTKFDVLTFLYQKCN